MGQQLVANCQDAALCGITLSSKALQQALALISIRRLQCKKKTAKAAAHISIRMYA